MKRLALLVLSAALGCKSDPFFTSRSEVDDALKLLQDGKGAEAAAALEALGLKNPRLAFDRGLAHLAAGAYDQAIAAFDEMREAKDVAMKATSYFHVGQVHTQKALAAEKAQNKDGALAAWKDAVAAFENALLLAPDHERAKQMLEVALSRVDPPCRMRNDGFDKAGAKANNTFGDAAALELKPAEPGEKGARPGERKAKTDLWLCPDDEDWFKVPLEPGDRLTASAKRREGPDFAKAAVEVWSPDGKRRVVPATEGEAAGESAEVPTGLVAAPGEYRVRLANPAQDDFGVTFELGVRPLCARTEDDKEPNDALAAAKDVVPGDVAPMRLCPKNEDWFAVATAKEGESVKVTAQLQLDEGTATLSLVDADGKTLAEGKPGKGGGQEGVTTLEALAYKRPLGKVYVRIAGTETVEAVYGLKIELVPPCPEREDKHEDNDTQTTAKDLAPGDHDGLQLCPRDPDVYKVTVKAGESIVAHLSAEPIAGTPEVVIQDASGKDLGRGVALEGGQIALALDPGPGSYFVVVRGAQDVETDAKYDLKVQVLPACPEGNDADEKNDTANDAKPFELAEAQAPPQGAPAPSGPPGAPPKPKQKLLRICPGDEDWFRIPIKPETPIHVVSIQFVHDKGDLELELFAADGKKALAESRASDKDKNGEAVPVPPPELRVPDPTDVLLRVSGKDKDTQNFYLLSARPLPPQNDKKDGEQNQDKKDQDKKDQDQQKPPQDDKDKKDQKKPEEPKKPEDQKRPDRSAVEKEMEKQDKNQKNLEAEKAAQKARRQQPPLKDW